MSLQEIKENAIKLHELRELKDELNGRLKDVNGSIRQLEEFELDSLMSDMGISDVTVDKVHVKRGVIFRGGVTSNSDKDAFKYLFDTNNEGALKQKVIIDLADQPNVPRMLDNLGIKYEINYSIHHMTLSSILKDLVSEGLLSTEDFEKYSIYAQPQIKVEMK